jgi:SAM-dependent methyltransferase
MTAEAVDYFGLGNPLVRWKARRSLGARNRMFAVLLRELSPTAETRVVDIGVTPEAELADSNAFERFYPWPRNVVATSFEDASAIEQRFPGVRFVRTDGDVLPFADGEFDVAVAIAVLEHVGDREHQRRFMAEIVRVSGACFLTTPNRWFPLELHTMLPLLHWMPQSAHQWVLRHVGLRTWAETSHLNLLSRRDLAALVPPGVTVTVTGHRILGWRSNLIAIIRTPHAT